MIQEKVFGSEDDVQMAWWNAGLRTAVVKPEVPLSEEDGNFLLVDLQGEALVVAVERQQNGGGTEKSVLLPLAGLPAAAHPLKQLRSGVAGFPAADAAGRRRREAPTATAAFGEASNEGLSECCYDVWGLIEWKQQQSLQQHEGGGAPAGTAREQKSHIQQQDAAAHHSAREKAIPSVSSLLGSRSKCSRRPVLHVGSLVFDGQVEEATGSSGAGIAVLRRTRRYLPIRSSCCDTSAAVSSSSHGCCSPAAAAASLPAAEKEEVCCWEVQAIIRQKITFTARPALHPSKKLFAEAAAPSTRATAAPPAAPAAAAEDAAGGAQQQQQETHARHHLVAPGSDRDSSRQGNQREEDYCWLLGVSPLLIKEKERNNGRSAAAEDWLLLVLDKYLLQVLEDDSANAGTIQLVGPPRLLSDTQQQQQEQQQQQQQEQQIGTEKPMKEVRWPAWRGTLLCCKERAYLIQRNAIDGQMIIAYAPPTQAAASSRSTSASSLQDSTEEKRPLQTLENEVEKEEEKENVAKLQQQQQQEKKQQQETRRHQQQVEDGNLAVAIQTTSERHIQQSNVLGVALVGICSSVLLVEYAGGRVRQIDQLLSSSSSNSRLRAWALKNNSKFLRSNPHSSSSSSLTVDGDAEDAFDQQHHDICCRRMRDINSTAATSSDTDIAAGAAAAAAAGDCGSALFSRTVLPSSVLLQCVQASQAEIVTHLFGSHQLSLLAADRLLLSSSSLFPSLSSLLQFPALLEKYAFLSAAGKEEEAAANTSVEKQNEAMQLRTWGQPLAAAADFSRSNYVLFMPQQKGYVLLSAAELRHFLHRLIKFHVFLPHTQTRKTSNSSSSDNNSTSNNSSTSKNSKSRSSSSKNSSSSSDSRREPLRLIEILDALREMEGQGHSLRPFTTRQTSRSLSRCCNGSSSRDKESDTAQQRMVHAGDGEAERTYNEGEEAQESNKRRIATEGDSLPYQQQQQQQGRHDKQLLLPLNEGVLFQLLVKIADLKHQEPLPFPLCFVDMCPPLVSIPNPTAAAAAKSGAASPAADTSAYTTTAVAAAASAPFFSVKDHSVECLHAYELFLTDYKRLQECEVFFNWLKLHALCAAAVFQEEGTCRNFASGIDCQRSTSLYSIEVAAFVHHVDQQLQQLPLYIVQEADEYLLHCVESYKDFLRQRLQRLLLLHHATSPDTAANTTSPTASAGKTAAATARAAAAAASSGGVAGDGVVCGEKQQRFRSCHIVEACINRLLVHAATQIPVIGYALVKSTLKRGGGDVDLLSVQQQQKWQHLPVLNKDRLMRACLNGFPELRIPAAAADCWSLEVAAKLQTSHSFNSSTRSSSGSANSGRSSSSGNGSNTASSRRDCMNSSSSSSFSSNSSNEKSASGSRGQTATGTSGVSSSTAAIREVMKKQQQQQEEQCRGQELWWQRVVGEQSRRRSNSSSSGTSIAIFLSLLKSRCFFAEGMLLLLPEEDLPLETRERLATLFMCKAPWWIEEIEALLLPSLMGKEMIGTIAGPPRRFCSTRQVVLNAWTKRQQQQQQSSSSSSRRRETEKQQQQKLFGGLKEKKSMTVRGTRKQQQSAGANGKKRKDKILDMQGEDDVYVVSDDTEDEDIYIEETIYTEEEQNEEDELEDDVSLAIYSHNLPLSYWPVELST